MNIQLLLAHTWYQIFQIFLKKIQFNLKNVWQSEQIKWVRKHHKNYTRKTITPGCRNCHHGMKKHGFNFVPEKWDSKENEWSEHQTRVK